MYQQRPSEGSTSSYSSYTGHYPNQYPTPTPATPAAAFNFPAFPGQQQPKPSPAPPAPPPSPPEPAVTPAVASKALHRLISSELRYAGFDSAYEPAVHRLEVEVEAFLQQLFERAHEYANLANRSGAIVSDLLLACEEYDLPPKTLYSVTARKRALSKRKRAEEHVPPPTPVLIPPSSRSPSPELLPSDDEDTAPVIPQTLRGLPSHFPHLPPKHTYLRTPASPPRKAALPSLEKKLKTAGLVQESLQNLLLATEENTNQEDGELLGHIVNWELGTHPRKRWKIGK